MSTVLVVEDSSCAREILTRILQRQGHHVLAVASGQEALDLLSHAHPDLLLLDVMMPEMDGFMLLARLRQQPATRDLPVILVTALSDEDRVSRARELGVRQYLVKTRFSHDELIRHVNNNLMH